MILLGQVPTPNPKKAPFQFCLKHNLPRPLKLSGLIHAVKGKERFLIIRVLDDNQIVIPFSQLLDKSDPICKKLAYVLRSATAKFINIPVRWVC